MNYLLMMHNMMHHAGMMDHGDGSGGEMMERVGHGGAATGNRQAMMESMMEQMLEQQRMMLDMMAKE